MRVLSFLVISLSLVSCISKTPKEDRAEDRKNIQAELQEEMSLKADREKLDELRKEIPADVQKQNDELALYLTMFSKGTEQPSQVRDRYSSLVQKRRTSYREKVSRLREDFRTQETRRREDFMDAQKKKRDAFFKRKKDAKAIRDFNYTADKDRQRYFADERDRRSNFESEISAQSRDFDSYMRERQKEFDEQYRLYSKKFSEKPREKKAVTGESEDFKQMKEMEATPLGTED